MLSKFLPLQILCRGQDICSCNTWHPEQGIRELYQATEQNAAWYMQFSDV
jgi:hypothetical protein